MRRSHKSTRTLAVLTLIGTLALAPFTSRSVTVLTADAKLHQLGAAQIQHVTANGPTPCLDIPMSGLIVHPTSCWVTGPTSIVVAGTDARTTRDGEVVLVGDQRNRVVTLPDAGRLRITAVQDGRACLTAASGAIFAVDVASGEVGPSCAAAPSLSSSPTSVKVPASSPATSSPSAPQPSSSLYVYGSYIDACGPSATTGCPLFNDGSGESVPPTGGMTILDFGAPCFDPSTLAWGTQLFNSQSCTLDGELVTLAQAWIRGYETNPNRSASTAYIVAAGTSNSLTAAVPGYALTQAQMSAHGQAWFLSVVKPIASAAVGVAAPVAAWSGSDIEESSDGNWYDAPTTGAWVDGYAAASAAAKPCVSTKTGLMVDYGDYVPNEPGWSIGGVYHVAWGAAPACPIPEIYYSANASEWESLNQWAQSVGLPILQFTGVLSEGGIGGTLSASSSWSALQRATGQSAPYLSVIGAIVSAAARPPDPPSGVTAVAGAASATVAWSAPAWDGGAKITAYTVTASRGGTAVQTVTLSGWPLPETTIVHGLTNGTAYTFTVSAANAAGTGSQSLPSSPVTPSELLPYTTTSTAQYHLTGSDGSTWLDLDSQTLSLTIQPSANALAVITANANLWTASEGVNQDLGIAVNGTIAAWKESGGYAAFSPDAAAVDAVYPVVAGTSYTVKLQWKTSRAASTSTIYAGAGPIAGRFSPTRLTLQLIPVGADVMSTSVTNQPTLSNSNGSSWVDMDAQHLTMTYPAPATGTVIVTGNADLWTATVGYNQDIGLAVNGAVVAWKEGGGAGALSPNAALVQAAIPVSAGAQYTLALQWKTNRNAPGVRIYAGAGPISGQFSPTRLTVRFVPSGVSVAVSTSQYSLNGSDGSTWTAIDTAKLTLPATGNCLAVLNANADLWTAAPGYNQDLAIAITPLDAIAYPGGMVEWKESGGAAAFSPNAAYLQSVIGLPAGQSYTITLLWKANRPAGGASIFAGAGSGTPFSPTSLTAELTCF